MDVAPESVEIRCLLRLARPAEAPERADELIRWGPDCRIATHPLHYISDMLFGGALQKGRELPLVEALLEAGSNFHLQREGGETALIGAASLGAERM